MSITFSCPECGKTYTTSDATAGKSARCKQCAHVMTIPQAKDEVYDLDDDVFAPPRTEPSRRFAPLNPSAPVTAPVAPPKTQEEGWVWKRLLTGLLVVAGIGLRVYFRANRPHRFRAQPAAVPAPLVPAADRNGPIETPPLPEVGPGREIEPGIMFHEMRLPGGPQPGFSGKLWLYLPSGAHDPKSLPCVLITGAGSNLLSGMGLAKEDQAEHLPYVREGFAVLAYELDGPIPNLPNANEQQIVHAARKFLAARAGLVNAHIALDFVLQKVPQVDPQRIATAGHSSAGTLAMLCAEHEPLIRGCVAYAPAIDLQKRFGFDAVRDFQKIGIDDLAVRYSPKNNESKLKGPIFLFHARDDSNVPVADTEASAARLKAMGKSVTLEIVPTGGHYESMIEEGIPRGIDWLKSLDDSPSQ